MNEIYIHYGSTSFDPSKFQAIKNEPFWSKPAGGLWAMPKDAKLRWNEWSEAVGVRERNDENSFHFTTIPNANILQINSVEDLYILPKLKNQIELPGIENPIELPFNWICLDFEKLLADGVDAIQVNISNDPHYGVESLRKKLDGWDCDTILIMNPDIIVTL